MMKHLKRLTVCLKERKQSWEVIKQQGISRPLYNLNRDTAQIDDDLSLYYHPT